MNQQQIGKLDTRNTGGLKQIADNMYFHHKALINVKPEIQIKPPKSHVNKRQQKIQAQPLKVDLPMYKNKNEFNGVFKTFQTVIDMKKGLINSSAPESMNFRRNITGNVSKAEKHQQQQHLLNMQSQQRRITNSSSKIERKKNINDPVQHPPHFFRRDGQSLATLRIDKLIEHMTKKHRNLESSEVQSLINYEKGQQNDKIKIRPQSSRPPLSKKAEKVQTKIHINEQNENIPEFVDQIPKVKGNDPADYEILKKDLIGTIFKYRIYLTDDLESLFGRVLVHNPQLELEKIEQIFDNIRDEFLK